MKRIFELKWSLAMIGKLGLYLFLAGFFEIQLASAAVTTIAENHKLAIRPRAVNHLFDLPIVPSLSGATNEAEVVRELFEASHARMQATKGTALDANERIKAHQQLIAEEVAACEHFVSRNPTSAWAPAIRANLGKHYRETGRYTLALQHWEAAWNAAKHIKDGDGKHAADYALAHWTRLLASLGRFETLTEVLTEVKGRVLDQGPLSQMLVRTVEGYAGMVKRPEMAYKCGVYALNAVARVTKDGGFDSGRLIREPSSKMGFTLEQLMALAEKYELGVAAVRREPGQEIPVPSVVHWQQNHYAAIVKRLDEGLFEVVDPTFEHKRMLSADAINAEASGWFLVPNAQRQSFGRGPTAEEARSVYGRGYPYTLNDPHDYVCDVPCPPGCPPGTGGSSGGSTGGSSDGGCGSCRRPALAAGSAPGGMPSWRVSEPYLNLWLHDTPLRYAPALGPVVSLDLSFKQRDESAGGLYGYTSVGHGWNCSWLGYVEAQSGASHTTAVYLNLPGGGRYSLNFQSGVATLYESNLRLRYVLTGSDVTSYELQYPDGSKLVFGFAPVPGQGFVAIRYFLSKKVDPHGKELRFEYEAFDPETQFVRLKYVIDADNKTNTIHYVTSGSNLNLISHVVDPWGRTTWLNYTDSSNDQLLTQITDVAGISSTITYDILGWPTQLTTPYGVTTFSAATPWDLIQYNIDRVMKITQPGGGVHLYVFKLDNWGTMSETDYASRVPQLPAPTPTFDVEEIYLRNSFYWSPKQVPLLSTQVPEDLNTADYKRARMKHWLGNGGIYGTHGDAINTLAMERETSPDGVTEGQLTWYDHVNKVTGNSDQGTQVLPSVIARKLPGGTTWYERYTRDSWGRPLTHVSTYGSGGTIRTHSYTYDANGNANTVTGPDGLLIDEDYNSFHQITQRTEHVNATTQYVTTFTYYSTSRLPEYIYHPNGTKTHFIYNANNRLQTKEHLTHPGNVVIRSESFTYHPNGLLNTHTDARGLVRTYAWDNLQRVTSIGYSSGGSETFSYTLATPIYTGGGLNILDLVQHADRLGKITKYTYNGLRQITSRTDPRNNQTTYGYCTCGALESVTATGLNRVYGYDEAGRQTSVSEGGVVRGTVYNLMGETVAILDDAGNTVTTYGYNNQGLRASESNPGGTVENITYDAEDRPATVTRTGGPTITLAYDRLGRLISRSTTGAGVETFEYSADGLTRHRRNVNGVNHDTQLSYDWANRRITRTDAKGQVEKFTFNAAGDLTTLVDGKNQTTTWVYDNDGRVTSKSDASGTVATYGYDANSRLTSRTLPVKGQTIYSYDDAGNLSLINYPNDTDVSFTYDALNRVQTMTRSGLETITFTYTGFGELDSETQPWVSGGYVDYTHNANGQRQTMVMPGGGSTVGYSYDSALRLQTVTSPAGSFSYTYVGGSRKVDLLTLPGNATIDYTYDAVGRLTETRLKNGAQTTLNFHGYGYDVAHRRTQQTRPGSYADYTYDNIDQLLTTRAYETPSGTERRHEKLTYTYDAAGNLLTRQRDQFTQTFSVPNALNQIASVTHSGTVTVSGMTEGGATSVTVGGQAASIYGSDNSFASPPLTIGNNYTASASGGGQNANNTVTLSLQSPANFAYSDGNGNLTGDGQRTFEYDDENQLKRVYHPGGRTVFVYDGFRRMRVRKEFNGGGTLLAEVRYIYDGRLAVQERSGNNAILVTYTRGLDLSETLDGAGGIGGLLSRSEPANVTAPHAFYHADGSGNVTMMINQNHQIVARYLYSAFGTLLGQSGYLADANVYRFSSKEYVSSCGLYYYGYRFYEPNSQRWLNRDPLQEIGGLNLYAFVANNPVSLYDPYGELPPSNPVCQGLKRKINNLEKEVAKRKRELYEDPQGLPGTVPGDDLKPSLSRKGHQKLLNMAKANLAKKRALYDAICNDPEKPLGEQCKDAIVQALPGTPEQLTQAGAVSTQIGVIAAGIAAGGRGGRIPAFRPTPGPWQSPPSPCPCPAPAL